MLDLRKIILRALLVSLALAAVAGVLAALTASDVVARVMGTGVATGGVALLMLPLSAMLDRRKLRGAGLCGIVTVAAEFVLALMLIWGVHRVLPGRWDWEELWVTGGVVLAAGLAGMIFLRMLEHRPARLAGIVGLAVAGGFFAVAMVATWLPFPIAGAARNWNHWNQVHWDLWETAWTIAGFGGAAVGALVGAGAGDRRHWRWLGVAAAMVAACILLVKIWSGRGDEYVFSLFVSGCVYLAWANLLLCLPVKPAHRWLRLATLAAGAATVMLTELIVFEFGSEVVQRLDAATAILAGCGTLGLGVLAMLSRPVDFESLPGEFLKITVVCPACRKKQAIELGGASCKDCGLRIEVRTAEPRCAECGYLLYRLTSDNCPECGTPIRREAGGGDPCGTCFP